MTPDERINAAWANLFVGCEPSVELRQLWRDTISAAVEEVEDRVANERDSHVERIAELESIITHSRQAAEDAWLGRKIKAAVEEEREECAKIADEEGVVFCDDDSSIAARIRARSDAKE